MKISFTTEPFDSNGKTDYTKMRECGFEASDEQIFCITSGEIYTCGDDKFKELLISRKLDAQNAGIELYQAHGPWPVFTTTPEKIRFTLDCFKRAVRGCSILGCKYLIAHPIMPYGWQKEADSEYAVSLNRDFFSELCTYAKDFDVNICIENMPTTNHTIADIPSIVKLIDELEMDNFVICLDTGHANVTRHNCTEMIKLCGHRLKALHVHDNKYQDSHNFPFDGNICWDGFGKALEEIGYTGTLSLETNPLNNCPEHIKDLYLKALYQTGLYLSQN